MQPDRTEHRDREHGDGATRSGQQHEARLRHPATAAPTRSEWITAVIGCVLVLGAIGYLLANVLGRAETPPDIRVEVGQVVRLPSGYLVRFRVRNLGHTTAAGLTVQAELRSAGTTVETKSTTFDYVPPGASRGGGFFFDRDPRAYELEVRPGGYHRP